MQPASMNSLLPTIDAELTAVVLLLTLLALSSTETQQLALELVCDVRLMTAAKPQPVYAHALLVRLAALQQVDIVLLHAQHPQRRARLLSPLSARLAFAESLQLIVLLLTFALLGS
jgi:hypothetical protein